MGVLKKYIGNIKGARLDMKILFLSNRGTKTLREESDLDTMLKDTKGTKKYI